MLFFSDINFFFPYYLRENLFSISYMQFVNFYPFHVGALFMLSWYGF